MVKDVWEKQGMPYNMNEAVTRGIIEELFSGVVDGYGSSLSDVDYNTPDYNMLASLQKDVYHFGAAKNYQQLKSLTEAIVADGKVRTWNEYKKAAFEINDQHINQWLKTEYNTAVGSAQMAGKWVEFDDNGILEYDAVIDEHTTDLCHNLNGVRKKKSDAFWDRYYPPNHFNERSTVRELNEGEETPDNEIVYPEKLPAMFAVNLGKRGLAFPPDHPYYDGCPQSVFNEATLMLHKDRKKDGQ